MEAAEDVGRAQSVAGAGAAAAAVATTLVAQGDGWELRQVAAAPGATHGPRRADVDACVVILSGEVVFCVDGQSHVLRTHAALFVSAGAQRAFVAGRQGALLLALHLPPRDAAS